MWVPARLFDWLHISRDSVSALREELSAVRAERDALKTELLTLKVNFDWLRVQVNQLQLERTALLEKAYSIRLPAPQLHARPEIDQAFNPKEFSFDDMGDELAKKLGLD